MESGNEEVGSGGAVRWEGLIQSLIISLCYNLKRGSSLAFSIRWVASIMRT